MRIVKKRDPFSKYYGLKEEPEDAFRCHICDKIIKSSWDVERNPDDGQLYHKWCLNKENEEEI